jgi:hypothetical protein
VKAAFAFVAVVVLAGCHSEDVGDERQMAALNGCAQLWSTEFPDLYGDTSEATQRRTLAVMLPSEINFDSKGYFYVEQPHSAFAKDYDKQFICRGNIETGIIAFVGVDNVIKRAEPGSNWSF